MSDQRPKIRHPQTNDISFSLQAGLKWLKALQKPDGEFQDCGKEIAGYYKALLLFGRCGMVEPGTRCLEFIKRNLRNSHGEICSGQEKTQFPRMQRNLANYIDGWVALGAWSLRDAPFAESIVHSLLKQQSPDLGGVFTGPKKWSGRRRCDLATAASCGRAFLAAGYRSEALKVGRFLAEALNKQTQPEDGLDLCFDETWKALEAPISSERSYYRLLFEQRGEKVWFPAFSCAFLCELHHISGEPVFLLAAKDYFTYITRLPEYQERSLANGKSGWAAGMLAVITGEKPYKEAMNWIILNVLARQTKEGEFGPSPRSQTQGQDQPTIPLPRRLETTAEFTGWSAEYLHLYSQIRTRTSGSKS